MQIGIFNDQSSPANRQITIRAYAPTAVSVPWRNLSNQVVPWINNALAVVPWQSPIVVANYRFTSWASWVWIGISIDTLAQRIQVYVNDTALFPADIAWSNTAPISNLAATPWYVVTADTTGAPNATATMTDLWFAPTEGLFDLDVTENRRQFITTSGCTASLGSDGSVPLSAPPAVYLTVSPGGTPYSFGINYGNGGLFEPVWINSAGRRVPWKNNAGQTINWLGAGSTGDSVAFAATHPCCGISLVSGPLGSATVNKLLMWDGRRWWTSQQDRDMIFIAQQEIDSVITAAGTDGTDIFYLMSEPSVRFAKVAQSKLWEQAIGYQVLKSVNRLWGVVDYRSLLEPKIDVTIDSELGQALNPIALGPVGVEVIWLNAQQAVVPWLNANGDVVSWMGVGNTITVFPPQSANGVGALTGMTLRTLAADMILVSMKADQSVVQYRG